MNLQGPISQKQFLYVGYTHLEWLLVPLGPQYTTHSYWRWPMKYRTHFIGHMLFIYFYLSPVAIFLFHLLLFLRRSIALLFLILALSFFNLLMTHNYRRLKMKKIGVILYFLFLLVALFASLFLSCLSSSVPLSVWLWHYSRGPESLLVEKKDKRSE